MIRLILFAIILIVLFLPIFKLVKLIFRKIDVAINSEANKDCLNEIKDKKNELIKNINDKENSINFELNELNKIKKEI